MSAKGGAGYAIPLDTRLLLPVRWLAGGSWPDLVARFGVSRSAAYLLLWDFVGLRNSC